MTEPQEKKRSWLDRLPPTAQRAYHDLKIAAQELVPFWHKTKKVCRCSWDTVFTDAKEAGVGSLPDTVHKFTEKAHHKVEQGKEWCSCKWEKAAPKIKESCKIVAEDAKEMEGVPLEKAKGAAHKAMDGVEKCCHKCTDKVKGLVGHKSGGKEE